MTGHGSVVTRPPDRPAPAEAPLEARRAAPAGVHAALAPRGQGGAGRAVPHGGAGGGAWPARLPGRRGSGEDGARAVSGGAPADAVALAEALEGVALPGGSVRSGRRGDVTAWPGFAEGRWWVQDAAAAIPARVLGVRAGQSALDL